MAFLGRIEYMTRSYEVEFKTKHFQIYYTLISGSISLLKFSNLNISPLPGWYFMKHL